MKTTAPMAIALAAAALLMAEEPKSPWTNFAPIASVQLQAEKYLYGTNAENNLDALWGRVNLGIQYKNDAFYGKIYFRAFPSNFGYEPLVGASIPAEDSLVVSKAKIDKFLVAEGFVKSTNKVLNVQAGRYLLLHNPRASQFGYYVDNDVKGGFQSRGAVYNAVQLEKRISLGESSAATVSQVDLIVTDDKINKGDLRICQGIENLSKAKLGFNVAYKANVFDRILDEKAVVKHTVDGQLYGNIGEPVTLFAEFAKKDFGKDANDNSIDGDSPILLGATTRFPKVINAVVTEFQICEKDKQDTFLWSVMIQKTFSSHLNFELAAYSMTETDQVALGIRMNSKL